jgi:tetratricopeptide (TPR) repeat protein
MSSGGVATAASEEALFFQYTELFLAAAERHPIVLFIDDLHWADRASVSLLTHLARRVERERVLIIGTYRPADVDVTRHAIREAKLELERYGIAEEFPLAPLDSQAYFELIREEVGAPPTPELLEWLERHAGSNPLFFGELLKWLVEQGIVTEHHGEASLRRVPESIEIPRSAEATIERRLSRLDPEVYRLIEYASVEGNEFGSTTLAKLLDMDELELEEKLEPLARVHRIIRMVDTRDLPNGDIASIYQFGHSLIQDVLHRNLQGKRRILLHRKMAEILESTYAKSVGVIAHKLAIHFDEGRLPARAYEFALQGAENARRMYAHRDAIELIRRALRNAQDDDQKLLALELLGETSHFIALYAEALAAYTEALDLAQAKGGGAREITLRRKLVTLERDHGGSTPDAVRTQLEELAGHARALGAVHELCEILWLMNALPGGWGSEEGIQRAREALALCEQEGERGRVARAHYDLARTLAHAPDPLEGVPHLRAALELFEPATHRLHIGDCYNVLGIVHLMRGDYRSASTELKAAADAFDEVGAPYHEAGVRNNLGVLLTRLGDWDGAEANLREAIRLNLRLDATATVLYPLENLADLYQTAGRFQEARDQWQLLLDRAVQAGYWNAEVIARCGIGVASLELRDVESARSQEQAARAVLVEHETWSEAKAAFHYLSAKLAAEEGEIDGALHFLQTAEEELISRDRYTWATFRLLRAEITSRRDVAEAVSLAREAAAAFEQIGSERMRARAETLLASPAGES